MAGEVDLGYGTLAVHLAARGIACMQYDKPGAGRTRARLDRAPARFERAIELAGTWLRRLAREVPTGTPLFLIGHSQGGQVALALADRRACALGGVVLLATAARDIDQVLRQQVLTEAQDLGLDPADTRRRMTRLAAFFAWLRKARASAPLPQRFEAFGPHREWYRELLLTAPARTLPGVKAPLLILQGERDIQVAPEDALALARLARRASSDVTARLWPGLDHLFMASPAVGHTALYADRRRRFSVRVARYIGEWIEDHCGDAVRVSSARNKSPTTTAGKRATREP
jgi:alpha-beta hydrolase superfamily lysophospholipase